MEEVSRPWLSVARIHTFPFGSVIDASTGRLPQLREVVIDPGDVIPEGSPRGSYVKAL